MVLADDALERLVYSREPVLLLFGDSQGGLVEAREAAARVGCRVAGEAPIAGALTRLDAQIGVDAVIATVSSPSCPFFELLDRMSFAARAGAMKGIVVAPSAMIDDIAADLAPDIEYLIDPSGDELDSAVALVTAPTPGSVHDANRRTGLAVLQQLSEEAARIASVLASLSEEEPAGEHGDGRQTPEHDAAFVRSIIRARRLRDQFFKGEIFADPAFDVLLDLYAARLEGSRVAVSSLCIAAAVPATTALRWIKQLTDRGLLVRSADPQDGRRVYIGLSDEAARAMERYLNAIQRSGLPAV